jgi:hypothetical protein
MIYAAPDTTTNSFLDGAPTGLVGTLTWKLLNADGTVVTAATTAGITEIEPSVYRHSFTSPSTEGDYLIIWTNGSTRIPEELTVTWSTPEFAATAGGNLTTLEAVRAFMQKGATDTAQDDLIEALIPAASRVIMQWTGREFAPATASATRKFAYRGGGFLDLAPYDLRSISSAQVDTNTTSATTLAATTDYAFSPLNSQDGVYTALTFPSLTVFDRPGQDSYREISITGAWGFAEVPADVQHWCNVTIVMWLRDDVSAFSSGFDANTDRFVRAGSLPDAVKAGLAVYRRLTVG